MKARRRNPRNSLFKQEPRVTVVLSIFLSHCALISIFLGKGREELVSFGIDRLYRPVEAKYILGLIYFRISDFKGQSTVATVPDHQSNKTCWRRDSF